MRKLIERFDRFLERLEVRVAMSMSKQKEDQRRVGHCVWCGEWCRGSLKEGFWHDDSGSETCHNVDQTAIPRQVYLEVAQRNLKRTIPDWKELNDG